MRDNVAIIIVNWNGKEYLNDCLNSLYNQTYKNFVIYLVDNGSVDDSVNFVKKFFNKVKIIKLNKNYGYAKGNNEGIKNALTDKNIKYIICLNNDTIVEKNWLNNLIKTAQKNNLIGSVTSKAYFSDGKTIQNAGLEFSKSIHINKKGGVSMGYGMTDEQIPELNTDSEVFAAGGVAALFKREMVKKIIARDKEFFDEDFFAYTEDYDIGFRMRSMGYISYLSANAKLIHLHSKTGGVASPFKSFYCERNSILTAIKNLALFDLLLFPLRNIKLKISYFFNKNESVEKLKENIGIWKMTIILVKANFNAFCLIPKYIIKRRKVVRK